MPRVDRRHGGVSKVVSEALCGVVEAIGTTNFATELLRSSRAFAPVDFVSVFLFPDPLSPIFFGIDRRAKLRGLRLMSTTSLRQTYP
jgi:hypothetical protein